MERRIPLAIILIAAMLISGAGLAQGRAARTSQPGFLGFDRNDYPGDAALPALRKTFAYSGYWLNPPPGENHNSWRGKRKTLEAAGFGFLVLFNGKLYAQIRSRPAALGKRDGMAAAGAATREGFPGRTVIFLDQEQGGRLLPEQQAYLFAWMDAVTVAGFRAGVYCSGMPADEGDGTSVVTAVDIKEHAASRDITYWVTNDACKPSPGCVFPQSAPAPATSGVGFGTVWQFAQSPRRREFTASCAATYAPDGNCYPPGFPPASSLHVDVNTATSSDPSHGRGEKD
ncbi:MAG: glycoside hydrolase domain-containing protein [Terriglobales bacterium]|jgi:hypothetical protein